MKTKIILLPENNNLLIRKAIKKFKNHRYMNIIGEIDFYPKLFEKEGLNINDYSNEIKILINSILALKNKLIDSLIVGIDYSSKDVFKWTIKLLNPNKKILSSCFIVNKNNSDKISIWGDCALNIKPDCKVAISNLENMVNVYQKINPNNSINIALLSYSTYNSGTGPDIDLINEIGNELKLKLDDKNINISNNIQFDAAIDKKISVKKNSEFHKPNIFWFPNLFSGNIGYKIARYYGKLSFSGPFILGTNYVLSDLSRSANLKEIVNTIKFSFKMLNDK